MSFLVGRTTRSIPTWRRLVLWHRQNALGGRNPGSGGTRQVAYDFGNVSFSTEKGSRNEHVNRVSTTKVASNIELRKLERLGRSDETYNPDRAKSLVVILFPFAASPKVLNEYCGLYHSYGLDVLAVRGRLRHSLHLGSGRALARRLLEYLTRNETPLNTTRFLFHSLSSGDYLYALMLNEMTEHPRRYDAVERRISGQIFDSVTTGTLTGPGLPVPTIDGRLRNLAEKSVGLYWRAFGKQRDFREKVTDVFRRGPVRGSVLVFCSFDDPLSDVRYVDELIERWRRERAMDVEVSSWTTSEHGRHLRRYPEQYRRAIHTFLTKLHLVPRASSP